MIDDPRSTLREKLERRIFAVLKDALAGKVGWRARARRLVGPVVLVRCSECPKQFEAGGKRRKTCSGVCQRTRATRRAVKCRFCGEPVVECKDTRHAALREQRW